MHGKLGLLTQQANSNEGILSDAFLSWPKTKATLSELHVKESLHHNQSWVCTALCSMLLDSISLITQHAWQESKHGRCHEVHMLLHCLLVAWTHGTYFRNSTQELWPPKPNELDRATLISSCCFSDPTKMLVSTSSSGSSMLRLGCT